MQNSISNIAILKTSDDLFNIFNSLNQFLISEDSFYSLSKSESSYSDESEIKFFTYGINYPDSESRIEFLNRIKNLIKEFLPEEIQSPFLEQEHLLIIDDITTLQIHLNDSTVTAILHYTGQY